MIAVTSLAAVAATASGYDGQPVAGGDHSPGFSVPDTVADRAADTPTPTGTTPPTTMPPELPTTGATTIPPSPTRPDPTPPCLVSTVDGAVFRPVFRDDFDGTALDEGAWYPYDSPGNAGFGLRRPEAISVSDDLLVITAQMVDGTLVSGGMAHHIDQTYGRWEFRVRAEPDPSGATSAVVLTWPQSENWPVDGEIDMFETGRTPDRTPFMTFVHYGADNSQEWLTHTADGTQWQVMAMEWTPERITMFRNGVFAGQVVNPDAIPHVPHHMTVQLDAWTDVMEGPVRMEVDWVQVSALDRSASGC